MAGHALFTRGFISDPRGHGPFTNGWIDTGDAAAGADAPEELAEGMAVATGQIGLQVGVLGRMGAQVTADAQLGLQVGVAGQLGGRVQGHARCGLRVKGKP